MIFKFLEKPITLTAVVPERFAYAHQYYPIVPSSKFIPSWWKKTPKSSFNLETFENRNTARSCLSIIETFKTGFIQPMWCDLAISIDSESNYKCQFSDPSSVIHVHSNEQFIDFYEDYFFFKLDSPWKILSSTKTKIIVIDPFYLTNSPKPFINPYGFLEIEMCKPLNSFLFLNKKQPQNILIKAGTPMQQIVALTDKPVKLVTEVISNDKYKLLGNIAKVHNFTNSGLETLRILKNRQGK